MAVAGGGAEVLGRQQHVVIREDLEEQVGQVWGSQQVGWGGGVAAVLAGLVALGDGITPAGITGGILLIAFHGEHGKVGNSIIDEHGVEVHLHPAGGSVVWEVAAIDQGIAGSAVIAGGQGGLGGVFHIDGDGFDGIQVAAAIFVEGKGFEGTGHADLGGEVDGFVGAVVVPAVERIALGIVAISDDHFQRSPHFQILGKAGCCRARQGIKVQGHNCSVCHGRGGGDLKMKSGTSSCRQRGEAVASVGYRDSRSGTSKGGSSSRGGNFTHVMDFNG
ncbi:MAG: hypothetical protein BWX83_00749 [Candidatus Cloacimonetes bacterium ADurb.Bin117]|nr:MAG: hypothetical protein BWX83_00749 [Candidatus Cloacimonetes bacterium ADurb.Bin117]